MSTRQSNSEPEIRQMYQRFLAGWAMDSLALRSAGLDRPCPRGANVLVPAGPGSRPDVTGHRISEPDSRAEVLKSPRHAA